MSKENSISIEIPDGDIQIVKDALKLIETTLAPYLIALTPEERRAIPKMADGTEPFVSKVLEYSKEEPQFNPSYLNVAEMEKDYKATFQLLPILKDLLMLVDNVRDTSTLTGSECYKSSLTFYNSIKQAAKTNVPNAKAIYDDLKQRFEANGKRKKPSM